MSDKDPKPAPVPPPALDQLGALQQMCSTSGWALLYAWLHSMAQSAMDAAIATNDPAVALKQLATANAYKQAAQRPAQLIASLKNV